LKTCNQCHKELELEKFGWTNKQKKYRRNTCMTCHGSCRTNHKQKVNAYQKKYRASNPAWAILRDSKQSDKRKNLSNDLDLEYVKLSISKPCAYCGETTLRMTLDRIDNSIGHLKSNVIQACIRCNYTRGNMPYKAWLYLVGGMRQARESGEFGTWTGSIWK
jgi:hypothetical protein